jgi:hypothetical protein
MDRLVLLCIGDGKEMERNSYFFLLRLLKQPFDDKKARTRIPAVQACIRVLKFGRDAASGMGTPEQKRTVFGLARGAS